MAFSPLFRNTLNMYLHCSASANSYGQLYATSRLASGIDIFGWAVDRSWTFAPFMILFTMWTTMLRMALQIHNSGSESERPGDLKSKFTTYPLENGQ